MKRWPNKASRLALIAAGIGLVVGIPAIGQDAPESLLPPGFDDPVAPSPPPPPSKPRPSPGDLVPDLELRPPLADNAAENALEAEGLEGEEAPPVDPLAKVYVPPLGDVGPLSRSDGGLGYGAYGNADGMMLAGLMHRLDAPLPSRWASILLRRALLSDVPTPRGVRSADWIAERAWLLVRMGEADSARMLVQSADVSQYSPWLFEVAMQTYLALADPAGLCPLADPATGVSDTTSWILARAMCAALAGEPGTATAAIDQARRSRLRGQRTFDLLLAEKVVGAGIDGRRAVTLEWTGVDHLTSWRYGLASATGAEIPAPLLEGANRRIQGWRAQAPFLPDAEKLVAGRHAAVLGVLSSAALVDLYGGVLDRTDPSDVSASPATKLRRAYLGDGAARMAALRELWTADAPEERFAALILTARAAARIPASADYAADAPQLIAAMLTAGLDHNAENWAEIAGGSGDAWALLALGAPNPGVEISSGRMNAYIGDADPAKARLVLAGLAGLGRLNARDAAAIAQDLQIDLTRESAWSRLLYAAADAGQPGTVALLAAIGMQTPGWRGVPPAHLYHIVAALRRAGLEPEARMIAAEAVARL